MNLINTANADSLDEVNVIWKCNIIWWELQYIKMVKDMYSNCKDTSIYIKSKDWYYILKELVSLKWEICNDTWSFISLKWLPEKWENIDILVNKDNYWYSWIDKNEKWDFIFFGQELWYKPEICSPNSNFIEFHKDYFLFWTWIIFIIILWVFLYKRFKK